MKFILKEDIRKRCRIIPWDDKVAKKHRPVSIELLHYLGEATGVDFPLYMRVDSEFIEYIKAKKLTEELLSSLIKSTQSSLAQIEIYVYKGDYSKFEAIIDHIRHKKIQAVLEKEPRLNQKVLNVYESLSSASQMVLRGGINQEVALKVQKAAAHLMISQLDHLVMASTIAKMVNCDSTLYDHSASVAMFTLAIGTDLSKFHLDKKKLEILAQCGLYHDVGKSCVPNHILNKPGQFEPQEYEIMKTHVEHGYRELLEAKAKGAPIQEEHCIVAHEHHERFLGHGYPLKKKGREEIDPKNGIHLFSRIVSIADVYSALLMKRVYKEAMNALDALELMKKLAVKDFDPDIFEPFYKTILESEKIFEEKNKNGRVVMLDEKDSFAQAVRNFSKP